MGLKAIIPTTGGGINTLIFSGQNTVNVAAASGITVIVIDNTHATTVNLPASPSSGQIVEVQDGGLNAATYNITVQGNGNDVNDPDAGASSSYVMNANGATTIFTWQGSLGTWGVS